MPFSLAEMFEGRGLLTASLAVPLVCLTGSSRGAANLSLPGAGFLVKDVNTYRLTKEINLCV